MKNVIFVFVLGFSLIMNGCTSWQYAKKAPIEKRWDTSNYQTCDDSEIWGNVIKNEGLGIGLLGFLYGIALVPLNPSAGLILGLPLAGIGVYIYTEGKDSIKDAKHCSEYKAYMYDKIKNKK